jgi:hypothetical protein
MQQNHVENGMGPIGPMESIQYYILKMLKCDGLQILKVSLHVHFFHLAGNDICTLLTS